MYVRPNFTSKAALKRAIAAAEREFAIARALPEVPRHVSNTNNARPWASYRVDDVAEALALLAKFGDLTPITARKNDAFVTITPCGEANEQVYPNLLAFVGSVSEGAVILRQHSGDGFTGWSIDAFPQEYQVRVHITVGKVPHTWSAYRRLDERASCGDSKVFTTCAAPSHQALRSLFDGNASAQWPRAAHCVKYGTREVIDLCYLITLSQLAAL